MNLFLQEYLKNEINESIEFQKKYEIDHEVEWAEIKDQYIRIGMEYGFQILKSYIETARIISPDTTILDRLCDIKTGIALPQEEEE